MFDFRFMYVQHKSAYAQLVLVWLPTIIITLKNHVRTAPPHIAAYSRPTLVRKAAAATGELQGGSSAWRRAPELGATVGTPSS